MRTLTARVPGHILLDALGLHRLDGTITTAWTEDRDGRTVVGLGIDARNGDGLWLIPPARRRALALEDYGRRP